MVNAKSALILGCGYTGTVLLCKLRANGVAVTATSRTAQGARQLSNLGAHGLEWSASEPLPPGRFDSVFVLFPPRDVDPRAMADSLAGQERVVYCGSTSVYGPQAGGEVTEDSPINPQSPWARARAAAEAALLPQGAMVVRAAGIYGPGRNIALRLRAGRLRNAGDPERPVNLIHVEDLAELLIRVAERGVPGTLYLGASGRPISWGALAQVASELTGLPVPERTVTPEDANLRMFYAETKRCRPTRYGELGFSLRWPDAPSALRQLASEGRLD